MKKRIVSTLLVSAMVLGMGSTAWAEETIGVGEGEVVTIWECNWGGDSYEAALQKLAEEATNANIDGKGYKVEVSMVSWDNYYETFMTAAVAGTAPDIACEASTSPYQYANMGVTLDLTPLYEQWKAEGSSVFEEIPEAAWKFDQLDGKQIAIPFAIDGRGISYRKDLFEAAGITELPTTWEGFEEACEKLLASGVTPIVFTGDNTPSIVSIGDMMLVSNGVGVIDKDYNPTILSEQNQEAYQFVERLYKAGYIPEGISGYSQSDAERMFLSGEAAMYISGVPNFVPDDMKDLVGVMSPFQGPSADRLYTTATYQSYYAFDQGGHPEATMAVLKWWIENNDILWTEGKNGTVPIRKSQQERVIDNPMIVEWASTWCIDNAVPAIFPLESFAPFSTALDSEGASAGVLEAIFTGGDILEASEKVTEEVAEIIAESME